jgi:Rps23 Pro-64 3,4-dihydroxylase Tpa1-like proline 4-hydroxylase
MSLVSVADNFLPQDVLNPLEDMMANLHFKFGWPSNANFPLDAHWNYDFMEETINGRKSEISEERVREHPVLARYIGLVEQTVGKFSVARCYANAYTYGTEGYPHVDERDGKHITVMLYTVDRWKHEWAGETAVWDHASVDIERAVLPRRNRVIAFPSARLHVGRSVSRSCPILRTVLVMKVKPHAA